MTKRKNISTNNQWKSQIIWAVITVGILVLLWLSVQKKANTELSEVAVHIVDLKDRKNLLSKKAVLNKCREHLGYDLAISTIKDLKLKSLEVMLTSDQRVKKAEVYVDKNNVINIKIQQKQPIIRVQGDGDAAYYLDEEGGVIPLVKGATVRVPIATGNIGKYDKEKIFGSNPNNLKGLYEMAVKIKNDEFLAALIEQVNVDSRGEFTLVPKIGKQQLIFGKAEDIDERFRKLKKFYKEGMPKVGWRKFEKFALNWDGQVVGIEKKKR